MIEAALERLDSLRDRLINKLDAMDTDADLEPFLGASEGWDQSHWSQGSRADLEVECEDEGGQCDDEGAHASAAPLAEWLERP